MSQVVRADPVWTDYTFTCMSCKRLTRISREALLAVYNHELRMAAEDDTWPVPTLEQVGRGWFEYCLACANPDEAVPGEHIILPGRARVVIAFDVDGTLSSAKHSGPVPLTRLRELEAAGATVVIVSPSGYRPSGFPTIIPGDREANLWAVRRHWHADLYLYVSDNGDQTAAAAAGFCYVDAATFV